MKDKNMEAINWLTDMLMIAQQADIIKLDITSDKNGNRTFINASITIKEVNENEQKE